MSNILTDAEIDALQQTFTSRVREDIGLRAETLRVITDSHSDKAIYYYRGLLFLNKSDAYCRMIEDALSISNIYMVSDDGLACHVATETVGQDLEIKKLSIK